MSKKVKKNIFKKENKKDLFWAAFLIFVFAFALYGNTIKHEFALDDKVVLEKNKFTTQGIKGIKGIFSHDTFYGYFDEKSNYVAGSRYRPLSLALFAIEYELFGSKPAVFHFFNILYYALTAFLLYLLLKRLLIATKDQKWFFSLPFIAAAIFLFHPVHTEVVANIKSRDEILAMILSLTTLIFSLDYIENKKKYALLVCGFAYFFALLAKEISVVVVAIAPILLFLFRYQKNCSFFKHLFSVVSLLIINTGLYFLFRYQATGGNNNEVVAELMNQPFLLASTGQKLGTIFYTLGLYLKLIFVPHPLTYDYYPFHIEYAALFSLKSIIPFVINAGLLGLGVFYLLKRFVRYVRSDGNNIDPIQQNNLLIIAVFLYFVPLLITSNLFFEIGAFMAERFLFFPSLGVAIALAWLFHPENSLVKQKIKKPGTIQLGILVLILLAFGAKTTTRNKAWKNNETLFFTDIKTSANSAKGNTIVGEMLYNDSKNAKDANKKTILLNKSVKHLEKAIHIHPKYEAAHVKLGNAYRDLGQLDKASSIYRQLIDFMPYSQNGNTQLGVFYANHKQIPDSAIYFYKNILQYNPSLFKANFDLGTIYITKHIDYREGIKYLEKAARIEPNNFNVYRNLAGGYFYLKDYAAAIQFFEKALALHPDDPALYKNIITAAKQAGDMQRVEKYRKLLSEKK